MQYKRKRPLVRNLFLFSVAIFASCLAAASDSRSSGQACGGFVCPSKFDYMVLASLADSPHLFAMTGYRAVGACCTSAPTSER
jgi:hypothetical protein